MLNYTISHLAEAALHLLYVLSVKPGKSRAAASSACEETLLNLERTVLLIHLSLGAVIVLLVAVRHGRHAVV